MAETGLYTCDELVDKLKALDILLDEAETQSKLDTGQSDHEYRTSVRSYERQYEKYSSMLQKQCPLKYRAIFGPSVINFRSRKCRN